MPRDGWRSSPKPPAICWPRGRSRAAQPSWAYPPLRCTSSICRWPRWGVSCYVDIGCASSRAIIAQGAQILFARSIKIGGEHLNRAVAGRLGINIEDAKLLRIKLCYQQPAVEDAHEKQQVQPEAAPAEA